MDLFSIQHYNLPNLSLKSIVFKFRTLAWHWKDRIAGTRLTNLVTIFQANDNRWSQIYQREAANTNQAIA